jgi:hypothetical protein
VFVLGRVHVVAQGISRRPKLGLKAKVWVVLFFFGRAIGSTGESKKDG